MYLFIVVCLHDWFDIVHMQGNRVFHDTFIRKLPYAAYISHGFSGIARVFSLNVPRFEFWLFKEACGNPLVMSSKTALWCRIRNKRWDFLVDCHSCTGGGLVEQVVFSLKHLHRQFEAGGTLHWYSLVLVAWSWLKSLQSQCTSFKEAAEDLTHASQDKNCSETDPNSKCVANVRLWIFQDECVAIEATVFLMLRRCLPQTQLWTRALQCTASINSWWHLSAGAMAYPNLDGQNPAALGMKAWFLWHKQMHVPMHGYNYTFCL